MKTIAYIDGYNLYYGRLKDTSYKWLDVAAVVAEILKIQDPSSVLIDTKYFTANIKARMATHGQRATESQNTYLRALSARGVRVYLGRLELEPYMAVRYNEPPDKTDRVRIWRLEEKETDVNLGLHMYRDAAIGVCDQIVLCSNDSDLRPAVAMIRKDFPDVRIGVVLPREAGMYSRLSGALQKHAHWVRSKLTDDELSKCQLPDKVATPKKPAIKPGYW